MKKVLSSLLFCWVVGSVYADPIGPSRALKIAAAYVEDVPVEVLCAPTRRGGGLAVSDTLAPYYIVSRGDNAGFVIVSGDDCLPEIIGYTDTGDFVEEQMPPALLDMLEGYAELVEKAQAADAPARAPRKVVAGRTSIDPIVKAHWHQSSPYNDLAPFITNTTNRAVTGCTCTAAVMVLHHFRRDLPGELLATTPTYGYGDAPVTVSYPKGTPILWDLMQYDYNGSYPEEMRNAVAVLNAAFGAGIWQTYGSSTSGQIANIVDGYNQYFNLSSTCQYKGGTNQTSWENTIYSNLVKGQPIVYAGVHPTNGGHAIILDGYNANNGLFHFNFGWGGQGDGYYTLDDETGVNGFSGQQGMVYNIAPKKPNVSAKLYVEPQAYRRVETTIRVSATNHGTLDYSGFNLYWSTTDRKPSSTTSVSESNKTLSLGCGESGEFVASFKPTAKRTYYVYLTDKNYNVLDKAEIEVQSVEPELSLKSFEATVSEITETYEGECYRLLNNRALTATATIANSPDATPLQSTIRMELMKYDEAVGDMVLEKNITVSGLNFYPGETTRVETTVEDLEVGGYYALCMKDKLSGVENDETLSMEGVDTLIRFKVCGPTLESVSVVGSTMILKGAWDASLFGSLALEPVITIYDLTQVTGISGQPIAANPNALFLTEESIGGYNVVCNGVCDELRLLPGFDFTPVSDFVARRAIFTPQWSIDEGWKPFALPFSAVKPDGYLCQQVSAIGSTSITEQEFVDTLCAYTPYMVMTCDNSPIVASDVVISAGAAWEPDTIPSFHAVVSAAYADDKTLVYTYDAENSAQYFMRVEKGTRIEPFTAVIKSESKRVRSHRSSSAQNKGYVTLALAIEEANSVYGLLYPEIEDEWNVLLMDSIRYAYDMFAGDWAEADEMEAYASRLVSLVGKYRLRMAHVDSPICYSSMLINPSFEQGNKNGWSTDGNAKLALSTNLYTFGVGMDGKYLLYNDAGGTSTDMSQAVNDLPVGYYRLTVLANAGEDGEVKVFAGEKELAVKAHPWGKYYLTEYTIDSVRVDDGSLMLGVIGGDSWYKVDDFNLYYLGKGVDDMGSGVELPSLLPSVVVPREGVYDLFGRRLRGVEEMIPGTMYIVDGRKIVYKKDNK